MRRITFTILSLLLLLIFTSNCNGYKPIFNTAYFQFEINDYEIKGDKLLGNKIYSQLHRLSKASKEKGNRTSIIILIDASKQKRATSKDSAGKILEYQIVLNTRVNITDYITGNIILNQTFTSSQNYKAQDQYYDTLKLENQYTEQLVDRTYKDLLIKLSQNITK